MSSAKARPIVNRKLVSGERVWWLLLKAFKKKGKV